MPMPMLEPVVLTAEERGVLNGWSGRRKTAQALAMRARIVFRCAEGGTIGEVAQDMGVSRNMVSTWRSRFLTRRLAGLTDEPWPGRPRLITDEHVERVITTTLEERPGQDTHWSTRSMASATQMSQSAISRIWRAFGLKPHVVETWKLSTDPQFIEKVRDVVGLYLAPPENELVLAVDEKSQMQAIDRTAPILPIMPARMTHDYIRHSTTSLFAAFDISSGAVIAHHYRRHRHQEFLRFLKLIDDAVPKDHRHQRRMGEVREQSGLHAEPVQTGRVAAWAVQLHRHLASQQDVDRGVDGGHATRPDPRAEAVTTAQQPGHLVGQLPVAMHGAPLNSAWPGHLARRTLRTAPGPRQANVDRPGTDRATRPTLIRS
jgi:transposase